MIFSNIKQRKKWKNQIKRIINKVNSLKIEKAGFSGDNTPYVKLYNGPIFFGPTTPNNYKKFYKILDNDFQQTLPEECLGISMDIIIRYKEGGLKLGGPKKEGMYKVSQGDIVSEMGAYRGFYVLYLSEQVGSKGCVIAIEPIPDNLKYLRRNVKENQLDNVIIVEKGIWKKRSNQTMYMNRDDMQSGSIQFVDEHKQIIEIEVDTLDNILSELDIHNVDFMVIQLNGGEFDALLGLTKLKPQNLAIASRYEKDGKSSAPQVASLLEKRGYKTTLVNNGFVYAWNSQIK